VRRRALAAALLGLAGCEARLPPAAFGETRPMLRPAEWFGGRTRSAGVFEDRGGAPLRRFSVDGIGVPQADGDLLLRQTVRIEGDAPFEREWRLRVTPDGQTTATGPAILGEGVGAVRGGVWHLRYTERLPPGGWHRTVDFEHWMYLSADGATLVNRFTIRKLGVVVARATELFSRALPRLTEANRPASEPERIGPVDLQRGHPCLRPDDRLRSEPGRDSDA